MATLTGRAPKDTYGDLMQVSNGNSGVDGTLRFLSDGKGGNSTLKLSSSTAQFTTTLLSTGLLTTTAGITSGSDIISDTDSTDSLGSTSVRWLKLWVDNITMGGAFAGATGTFSSTLAVTGLTTIASLKGTGAVTITDILDEDNMSSNSATKLATQQSIKAYVDSQVDTVDTLAEVLAIGNTTGGTDVSVTTTDKVQFRDAAIYINSSVDGQLDIVADTEIQIAATTIDINGAVNASGEIIAASLDISGDIDVDGTANLDIVDIDGAVDMASTLTVAGLTTIASLKGTGAVTVTDILDEDNMASNSATKLSTQQSIKAYVDAQVDTADTLAEVLAIGNTTGGTDVSVSTTDKVQFRDAAIYINSSADGQLDIVADTEIQIAATTVDINGAINASGEIIAASLDISGDIDVDGTSNLDIVDIDGAVNMATTALVTGVLTTTAATVHTNGITMPDSAKAIFGAGSDLQIYHDASNSYIDDTGTGGIKIRTGGVGTSGFHKYTGESLATFEPDGPVTLYYDNAVKLATASGGVTVTGTITSTGDIILAGGANRTIDLGTSATTGSQRIRMLNSGDYNWQVSSGWLAASNYEITPSTASGGTTFNTPALKIAGATGNATFSSDVHLDIASGAAKLTVDSGSAGAETSVYYTQNGADRWRSYVDSNQDYGLYNYGTSTESFNIDAATDAVTIAGALSKGSGSFKIDHPLPELNETHNLVYSFTESPQADLIHRGKVALVNGAAEVNIDVASKTTEGTFVLLCGDVQCFTTNETDWCPIRGSVSGNILTIEAQDNTCTDTISWMVIGERKDQHMLDNDWCDDEGHVINEPLKPVVEEEEVVEEA